MSRLKMICITCMRKVCSDLLL